ncbi:hypothetical protein JA1_000760 [Spathaspora sp. JA1]|nr:hypothetical protein JA1_000760 [Spathaspora sp. JA1]
MAHPGRPRGRTNKKTQLAQAAAQAQAQAQAQAAQAQAASARAQAAVAQAQIVAAAQAQAQAQTGHIKEDPSGQLHDEADLVSFRNDALIRYITNHEYIENITGKLVHTCKIIPPSLYPNIPKRTSEELVNKLRPEDVYFGDLTSMKYVENKLVEDINKIKQLQDPLIDGNKEYKFQRDKVDKLVAIQHGLYNKESFENLESEIDQILSEYQTNFNRKYYVTPSIKQYSIPIDQITPGITVSSAPPNYNPKSITSIINLHTNNNPTTNNDNNNNNNGYLNDNAIRLDATLQEPSNSNDKFNDVEGMFMNQFEGDDDESNYNGSMASSSHNFAMTFTTSQENQPQPEEQEQGLSGSNGLASGDIGNEQQQEQQQNVDPMNSAGNNDEDDDQVDQRDAIVDDDMSDLLKEDLGPNQAIEDDIGDLFFNDDGDDNGLLGGSEFDQDFLSQIDQSME